MVKDLVPSCLFEAFVEGINDKEDVRDIVKGFLQNREDFLKRQSVTMILCSLYTVYVRGVRGGTAENELFENHFEELEWVTGSIVSVVNVADGGLGIQRKILKVVNDKRAEG